MVSGLAVTFVEAPDEVRKTLEIPGDHFAVCKRNDGKGSGKGSGKGKGKNIPIVGNAAGRGLSGGDPKEWLMLNGQPSPPGKLPEGFTRGGIAAFVISCLMGILGVLVVGWYGFSEPLTGTETRATPDSNPDSASAARHTERKLVGDGGGVSGLFDGAGSAAGSAPRKEPDAGVSSVIRVRRGTEAVESEALSFGSEEEAVNAVGSTNRKEGGKREGNGVNRDGDGDGITRA